MSYRIALIPGDGIGREVVPEGVRALKALSGRFTFAVEFQRVSLLLRALSPRPAG